MRPRPTPASIALLIASAGAVAAAEAPPVYILLRGPNPIIQGQLDELPRMTTYDKIAFPDIGASKGRTLVVARSGGIGLQEIIPILRAIELQSRWRWLVSPWRLAIHGDASRARVVVSYCDTFSDRWLVVKENGIWEVLDVPRELLPRCLDVSPDIHESEQ